MKRFFSSSSVSPVLVSLLALSCTSIKGASTYEGTGVGGKNGTGDEETSSSGSDSGDGSGTSSSESSGSTSSGESTDGSSSGTGDGASGNETEETSGETKGEATTGSENETDCFDEEGNSPCEPFTVCQPGEYIERAGSEKSDQLCTECSPGTFSDAENAEACTACPIGTFADKKGATQCNAWSLCDWDEQVVGGRSAEADLNCEAGSSAREAGTAQQELVRALTIDKDGNVYVAGTTLGVLGDDNTALNYTDVIVSKFNSQGDPLWTVTWGEAARIETVSEIAVDSQGQIYVIGNVNVGGFNDAYIVKLDSDGEELWSDEFGEGDNTQARGLAIDRLDDVYVTGGTDGVLADDNENGDYKDAYVRKYAPNKDIKWTHQFGDSSSSSANSVAVDSKGRLYVTGSYRGTGDFFGNPLQGLSNIFLLSYDQSSPDFRSTNRFGGSAGYNEQPTVRVNQNSSAFLGGHYNDGGNTSFFFTGVSSSTDPAWPSFGPVIEGNSHDRVFDIGFDKYDNPLVFALLGSSQFDGEPTLPTLIRKTKLDGTKQWNMFVDISTSVAGAVAPSGHIFIASEGKPLDDLESKDTQMIITMIRDPDME